MSDPGGPTLEAPSQRAVPVRHPGRWVAAAGVLVLVAMFVHTVTVSRTTRGGRSVPRFEWNVVGQYFLARNIITGLVVTIELTAVAMVVGVAIGVLLAVMRLSPNPLVSGASWLYIWFFRGTPVLVQLFFWYDISYLYPRLALGVPFGPAFIRVDANTTVTSFLAALIGLGLNEGAYMAEIVRAGMISVDEGQTEAAQALGLSRLQTLRSIVLPQAMRVIVPPTGNETISMLKTSSLVSAITVGELLFKAQQVYARTYQPVPLLMVASMWYLAVTSILTAGQYYVERHFARGVMRQLPLTPLQRLRALSDRISGSRRDPPRPSGTFR